MAHLKKRSWVTEAARLLSFGIPLLAIAIVGLEAFTPREMKDIPTADNQILECDIGKTTRPFTGDIVYIEILIDGPEPNHFGYAKPDEFFDDVFRLCRQRARIHVQYLPGEMDLSTEIGNWIVSLKSMDDNQQVFSLEDYLAWKASSGLPWFVWGVPLGIVWVLALLVLFRERLPHSGRPRH